MTLVVATLASRDIHLRYERLGFVFERRTNIVKVTVQLVI
jgi:hypothetical protein